MARQLRQDPPGGWHHITNRGARRYDTFIDDEDRASFLDYVIKACDRFGARLVSYCLMANHYHLVMHCPDGQVSSIVQTYAANYTRTFNRDHGFDGRLHSARFHNTLLTSLEHAVVATRYGHRNPIEVGYDAISFPWSSLGIFVGERPTPTWLDPAPVIDFCGGPDGYRTFVELDQPSDKAPWSRGTLACLPSPRARSSSVALEAVSDAVRSEFGVSVAGGVTDSGRTSATARGVAVLLALEFGRVSAEQVADFFGLSSAGAARATASRMRRNVERDEGLRHRIENVRSVVAHAPITRAS